MQKVALNNILKSSWMILLALLFVGCATSKKIDWNSRVGVFSFDDAVYELGPPDKSVKLSDGVVVADWLTQRGFKRGTVHNLSGTWIQYYEEPPAPNRYIRLIFDSKGKLQSWKRVAQ